MNIAKDLTQLIGNTPLLQLTNYNKLHQLQADLIGKLEYFNPLSSIKDRIGYAMIEQAERSGKLQPGAVIIEPTSGNTGIGLAFTSAIKGYRLILTMPETMSIERRKLLSALGAEIVLTPGSTGMNGAVQKALELAEAYGNSFVPQQFNNPANPEAHYCTTGPEIWRDTDGQIDYLVSGVGTGGTISGVGKYLKERNEKIKIIAVEPSGSPILSGGQAGPHRIQGIGAGFIPDTLDRCIYDEVITVDDEDAIETSRQIAKTDGLLVGVSSGAAIYAANEIACRVENKGKKIVVILPDSGERYLSADLY